MFSELNILINIVIDFRSGIYLAIIRRIKKINLSFLPTKKKGLI